jgi:phosphoglycolate phosphatase
MDGRFPGGSIRAVAFDLDGTLVDSAPDLVAAVQAMLRDLQLPGLADERIVGFIGGGVELLVERAVTASRAGTPAAAQLAAATRLFRQHYAKNLFVRSTVYPGVPALLATLRNAGLRCCCVTNKAAEFAEPLLVAAGLAALLEFTLTPVEAAQRKPSPRLLEQACTRFGLTAPQLLMVGDSGADFGAARAAGCPVVLVRGGYAHGLEQAEPEAFLDQLADLTGWLAGR